MSWHRFTVPSECQHGSPRHFFSLIVAISVVVQLRSGNFKAFQKTSATIIDQRRGLSLIMAPNFTSHGLLHEHRPQDQKMQRARK